jgi:hypothetical protein
MKRFARMLFAGLGIAIAGTAMSLVPHKAATAGGMTAVTVTNVPLPVTQSGPWNVGITGTPNVNIGTPTVNLGPGSTVGISGTPTVTIGGSSVALPTQDLSTFASANVSLQNRVPNTAGPLGLIDLSSTGVSASCCFAVPAGQTLVVTSIDISPVTPGPGTNHIFLSGSLNGAAPAIFRSLTVSNANSTHLDYPTGIAFGSTERLFIQNGQAFLTDPLSAGDVDIYLQGYLTSN